jgi:leucyl-tRNA synthetase
MDYNFSDIERRWRQWWTDNAVYKTTNDKSRPKYYVLDMFPYPSGAGLHVGHPLGYIASDIYARYKRMQGYNVLHPMGYDAFGLPAEQYAMETGQHPAVTTEQNIRRYREQLDNIGFSFDWSREVRTSDPNYYKWTQWIFIKLFHSWFDRKLQKARPIESLIGIFEKEGNVNVPAPGDETLHFSREQWKQFSSTEQRSALMHYRLAYLDWAEVWWCEALGTVLANDEVINGVSERGGYPCVRKKMRQWMLRITEYAERLLEGLDGLDWSDAMKDMQRNWIGKSSGAQVTFDVKDHAHKITVFTTRPDTIFGVDFMVLAPEHELVGRITTEVQQAAVAEYKLYTQRRSERERISETKTVTGAFTGAYAVHPFTRKSIPIYISEYVLASYGTGAIMGVPSGDERDHAFARHMNIPITNIFGANYNGDAAYTDKEGTIEGSDFLSGLPIPKALEVAIRAVEDAGIGERRINYKLRDAGFSRQRYWGEPFPVIYHNEVPYTIDEPQLTCDENIRQLPVELPHVDSYKPGPEGQGPLANIEDWVNLTPGPSPKTERGAIPKYSVAQLKQFEFARINRKAATPAEELLWQNLRSRKLDDCKFRRQHPIDAFIADFICLEKCLIIEVDGGYHNTPDQEAFDKHRTEKLKELGFEVLRFSNEQVLQNVGQVLEQIKMHLASIHPQKASTAGSTSPLPQGRRAGGEVRETNTMPGYAGSSWYFFRYMDPHNDEEFASREATDYWQQVDVYVGGTEHAVGHLLYARMWTKVLADLDLVSFDEPFKKLVNQGMIQGSSRFVYRIDSIKITNPASQHVWQEIMATPPYFISFPLAQKVMSRDKQTMLEIDRIISQTSPLEREEGDEVESMNLSRLNVDIHIVDGVKLNIEEFKKRRPDLKDTQFIFEGDSFECEAAPEKMSKSKYNVVNPDDIVAKYGADTFRMYEMFLGPIELSKPWDTQGIEGVHRFLKKLWRLYVNEQGEWLPHPGPSPQAERGSSPSAPLSREGEGPGVRTIHRTIKKIGEDIERFGFNTCVSALMICVNELSAAGCRSRDVLEALAVIIAPFAPHLAEELWHRFGHQSSVVLAPWPRWEEQYLTESSKTYPVAVNGKPRAEMRFALDESEANIRKEVLANETIAKWLDGKEPKKFIYVKGKMINVVV